MSEIGSVITKEAYRGRGLARAAMAALANANTVDANGKWKFEAMCSGNGIETVRFKSLTGF